jgi:copper chaperone
MCPAVTIDTAYVVSGLNCGGCVDTLTRKAMGVFGVVHVEVELEPGGDSRVVIRHAGAVDPDVIGQALTTIGYRVELVDHD